MNIVILSGRLTKDPEIRYTKNKKAVATFTLAVDDGKSENGRKAQFLSCVAWEKAAEILDQYFRKGDGLTVNGKLTSRSYEKDGQRHYITEVLVNGIEFPLSKKETYGDSKTTATAFEDLDEDIDLPY